MKRTRLDRRKDFETFFNNVKTTFDEFCNNDKSAEKFQNMYKLYICPGSRAGGTDKRVVEIFWGSRPFETITEGRNWKSLSEFGATLLFAMDDNGHVIVSLYPAYTENRKPVETCITLNIWLDPSKLLNRNFLKNCWRHFMSYMEYTSLDGNPSAIQKIDVWYLRNFKFLIIDNKWTPTKSSLFRKEVFKWVLTVGLSGSIIYFLTVLTQPKATESEIQLKQINNNLEYVSKQLDNLSTNSKSIKTISTTIDSIEVKTRQIFKAISKPK